MSKLYMSCTLCGRKQAQGLLSHASWAIVEVSGGSPHRVCPGCREQNRDWEERTRAVVIAQLGAMDGTSPLDGGAYR